jgi:hypothetical protein
MEQSGLSHSFYRELARRKETAMSAMNSGLFLVSAVASGSGFDSVARESFKLRTPRKLKRSIKRVDPTYRPLSASKKQELMQSILRDDWHE